MRVLFRRESGSGRREGRRLAPFGSILSVALASFLMAGGLLGFMAGASAATSALTVTVGAGGFAVKGNPVQPYTKLGKITGSIDPTTGAMTGVTLPTLSYHLSPSPVNTNTTETVIVSQVTPGATTGSVNATGDVSITATEAVLLTIHFGSGYHCYSARST